MNVAGLLSSALHASRFLNGGSELNPEGYGVLTAVTGIDSYDQWKAQALRKDDLSGAASWRARDESTMYDYRVIRRRYDELREVRASGDVQRLLFYMHEGFHGNMAGMGSPALYTRAKFGRRGTPMSNVTTRQDVHFARADSRSLNQLGAG